MSKSGGTTRSGSASNPRGVARATTNAANIGGVKTKKLTIEDFDKKVEKVVNSSYGWQGSSKHEFIDFGTAKGEKLGTAHVEHAWYEEKGKGKYVWIPTVYVGNNVVVNDVSPVTFSSKKAAQKYALDELRKYHLKRIK